MEDIGDQNWERAHRLFQCVSVAARPLHVEELADILAFDFDVESTPVFRAERRSEDPVHTVLTTCSSLLAVVDVRGFRVVQFAHFSVKEYLTSARLAETKRTISRFHVSMMPAHTNIAQACLGILLHLEEDITGDGLEDFPLAKYAAEYWPDHARFNNVSSNIFDGTKRLFDPKKHHLSVWLWIYDPICPVDPFDDDRPDRPEEPSLTPLHYVAACGLCDVATFLIVEHEQVVNSEVVDEDPTPLHLASEFGHADFVQLLLEHGADTTIVDDMGFTPLGRASDEGHLEVARLLLEHVAEREALDSDGDTALLVASERGHVDVARMLLEHGVDMETRDKFYRSPLACASGAGHVRVAQVLLEHGADVKAQTDQKSTPLHIAANAGQLAVARVLQAHGADLNAQDVDGLTPLHEAEGREVAQFLINHGADANALDFQGETPLHVGSQRGHVDVVRVLLEHGVDVNARDANNATPLHLVCALGKMYGRLENDRIEIVRLLLQYGADIYARDDKGQTPVMRETATGSRPAYCDRAEHIERIRSMFSVPAS